MESRDPNQTGLTVGILPPEKPRLKAFVEPFLADQCNIRKSSIRAYRTGLRRFLAWLEATGEYQPSRDTIIAYKRDMEATGLSAGTRGPLRVRRPAEQ